MVIPEVWGTDAGSRFPLFEFLDSRGGRPVFSDRSNGVRSCDLCSAHLAGVGFWAGYGVPKPPRYVK